MGLDYGGLIEGAEVYKVGRAEVVRVDGQRAAEKEAEKRSTSPDIVSS